MLLKRISVRVVTAIATLFVVSLLLFVGIDALPGNAAQAALGINAADKERVAVLEREFGLDRPVLTRYADWLDGFVHGDLGKSLPSGNPVSSTLSGRLMNTVVLAGFATVLLVPISLFLGVISALRRDTFLDHAFAVTTLALISTPEFVVGALLIALFAKVLGVLPGVSLVNPNESIFSQLNLIVLPVLTLLCITAAQATRLIRATTTDVFRSNYVQSAILRGTPPRVLLRRHVIPNAVGPAFQVLALTFGYFVGGVVVTEAVFQYPGLGNALVSAVGQRDVATVQAIGLIVSAVYIFSNLAADVTVMALNPRLRRSRS